MVAGPFARSFRLLASRRHGTFLAGRLRAFVLAPPAFGLMVAAAKLVGYPAASMTTWQFVLLVLAPGCALSLILGYLVDRAIGGLDPKDKPSAADWLIFVSAPVLGLIAMMAFMR